MLVIKELFTFFKAGLFDLQKQPNLVSQEFSMGKNTKILKGSLSAP